MVIGHRHQLIEDWAISSSLADAENRSKIAEIFLPNYLLRLLIWLQEELLIYSKDLSSFNLPLPVAVAPISNTEAFLARERIADVSLKGNSEPSA